MSAPRKTALVTGASRGIGRGIAFELAAEGFGLTVTSRSQDDLALLAAELMKAGAADVVSHAADLVNRDALAAVVDAHAASFRSMDALVLSGGVGTGGEFGDLPRQRVDKTVAVNFLSTVELVQRSLPWLREAAAVNERGARVILLASVTGVFAEPGLALYGATKAAMISLAEALNAEESGRGVMVTAIAPGFVDTDMAAWTTDIIPAEKMIPVRDIVSAVRMLLALGRNTSVTRLLLTRSGVTGYQA